MNMYNKGTGHDDSSNGKNGVENSKHLPFVRDFTTNQNVAPLLI